MGRIDALINAGDKVRKAVDDRVMCLCCFNEIKRKDILFRSAREKLEPDEQYSNWQYGIFEGKSGGGGNGGIGGLGGGMGSGNVILRRKVIDPKTLPGSQIEYSGNRMIRVWEGGTRHGGGIATTEKICPVCHHFLPDNAGQIISIVGPTNAGKTVFLLKLIEYIRSHEEELGVNFKFYSDDDYSKAYYNAMIKQLNGERLDNRERDNASQLNVPIGNQNEGIGATATRYVPPVSFIIENAKTHKALTVSFFDFPGEKTEDTRYYANYARHTSVADGLLYIYDPFTFTGFHPNLSEEEQKLLKVNRSVPHSGDCVNAFAEASRRSPEGFLQRTAQRLMPGKAKTDETRTINRPVGIVLTKSDYIPGYFGRRGESDVESATGLDKYIFRAAPPRKVFDNAEAAKYSAQIERFCGKHDDNIKRAVSQNFSDFMYFMVSSTGSEMRNGQMNAVSDPRNIEKPLMWLLSRFGIIESTGGKGE